MAQCVNCQTDTELYHHAMPICLSCAEARQATQSPIFSRKPMADATGNLPTSALASLLASAVESLPASHVISTNLVR
jgi:hypothetical protein